MVFGDWDLEGCRVSYAVYGDRDLQCYRVYVAHGHWIRVWGK